VIFLSLKTYPEATGDAVIKLLAAAKTVSSATGVPIIPCAQTTDIYRIKQELGIEVWAQHVDPIDPGRHSGWISPYAVRQAGATGTVINHAEHPLEPEVIHHTILKAREYQLKTLVLCETLELARQVSAWNPDYIGYEKGALIAGPVAMIDQEEANIRQLAQLIPQPLIVGAGITSGDHVRSTLAAGGKGVILASALVKAPNAQAKLRELVAPFGLG
jgi:triosephosphate isomerase (TIM)